MGIKNSDYYKSGRFLENSKSASKLGTKKILEMKQERIEIYNKNPNSCKFCGEKLYYDKRNNNFCSTSCSAKFNNKQRKKPVVCENCGNEFIQNRKSRKYCSKECSLNKVSERSKLAWKDPKYREKISNKLKKAWIEKRDNFSCGEKHSNDVGKTTKGKYKGEITSILDVSKRTTSKIIKRLNISCCICGWNKGTCDIHHINGKKIENCNGHDNLTYVCPNCHRLVHEGKIKKDELITLESVFPENWMDLYYG